MSNRSVLHHHRRHVAFRYIAIVTSELHFSLFIRRLELQIVLFTVVGSETLAEKGNVCYSAAAAARAIEKSVMQCLRFVT